MLLLLILAGLLADDAQASEQPHIVLLLADDLGWMDVPWHNSNPSNVIAPTLLDLANNGVTLSQHYVQPVCTPTRGAIMTGKYAARLGLQHSVIGPDTPYGLKTDETTMAQVMRDMGYSTHAVGKWHLGHCSWDHTPVKRGFDTFYGFYNGALDYYTKKLGNGFDFRYNTLNEDGTVNDEVLRSEDETYSTYLLTDRAVELIEAQDKDEPMFLYLPFQNPHTPHEVPDEYYELYEGIEEDEQRRTVLAMISALDDAVYKIVQALETSGLWENTVFVFMADNGGNPTDGQYNYPLRGTKGTYWEGGIRSAAFVHSPLINGGVVSDELIHVTDWLPTFAHLGSCGLTDSTQCNSPDLGDIDGVNQWSAIDGSGTSNRTGFLVNIDQMDQKSAVREGQWKLLRGDQGRDDWFLPPGFSDEESLARRQTTMRQKRSTTEVQLYDVISDPYEENDLSEVYPDVVKTLQKKLQSYRANIIYPTNEDSDRAAKAKNFGGVWTPWLESC